VARDVLALLQIPRAIDEVLDEVAATDLAILSALSPMRYAVELMRNVVYGLQPGVPAPDMTPFPVNAAVIAGSFVVFLVAGTILFVRSERNR